MPSHTYMLPLALARAAAAHRNAASAQEQVVKIGVSGPLSGANAFAGKDNENGVRLAIEELNAKKIKVGGKPCASSCSPKTTRATRRPA